MSAEQWAQRLLSLGVSIQHHVHKMVQQGDDGLAMPVDVCGGDTIFEIDRRVEPLIEREIDSWPSECKPLILVAEGMGDDGRCEFGPAGSARFRVIVDPIDGTRGIMYDKRSAWFLAAVAENRGDETCLADTFASVMVELPTSKQAWCDSFIATRDTASRGYRSRAGGAQRKPLPIRPSRAESLRNGFGHVANFFPGAKLLAAELAEHIARKMLGEVEPGHALLFDDQYISTGGQMAELIFGHDRFCCDLRPLFHRILARERPGNFQAGLECHPYDVAGTLVALQAGLIITDGFGRPLNCPLDVETGVHWCGYANQELAVRIKPIVSDWLSSKSISPTNPV